MKMKEFFIKNLYYIIGGFLTLLIIVGIIVISIKDNNKDDLSSENIEQSTTLNISDLETTTEINKIEMTEDITEETTTVEQTTVQQTTTEQITTVVETTQEITTVEKITTQQVVQNTTEIQIPKPTQKQTEPPTPKPTEPLTEACKNEYVYNKDGTVNIKNSKIYNQLESSLPEKVVYSDDIQKLISQYSDSYLESVIIGHSGEDDRYVYTALLSNKTAFIFYIDDNNDLIYGDDFHHTGIYVLYKEPGYTYLN